MVIWIWLTATLRANPELAIFLTLAIGYRVGSLKFGGFSLGPVTGTLLAGVLIGQLGIDISPQIKSIFFILFLFAVGFGVGPQFVRGLANDGLPQAVFAVVISLLCLLGVYIAARVSGYGPGLAAGLLAGSQTISASIGLATDAINQLGLPPQQTKQQLDLIPVAYAVCYLFGTIGTGWIIAFAGPKILRIDLEKECKRYEQQLSAGAPADGMMSAWNQYVIRAFKINQPGLIEGKTVAEAEKSAGERLFLENLRRDGKIIPFTPDTRLQIGDIIAVSGKHESLIEWSQRAEEVNDAELLNIPVESVDLFITNKWINGKTLLEIARHDDVHGVYLTRIRRGSVGVDIPVQAQTVLNRGDIVTLVGTRKHVDAASQRFGYADRPKVPPIWFWSGPVF